MERKWSEPFVPADLRPARRHVETEVNGRINNDDTEEHALAEWRRKATDIVSFASALVHVPLIILVLVEFPAFAWSIKISMLGAYTVVVAAALLRRIDHRIRVSAGLCAIYVVACVGIAVSPQRPYLRVLPIIVPMLAIGLIGVGAARVATLLSAGVLIFTPFLCAIPAIASVLGSDPEQARTLSGVALTPGIALSAEMVVVMVLLERLYKFLLRALVAQRVATAEQSATALRLENELQKRRRLEREIARVTDDERRHLGNEIHDGVCQQLTGALLRCQALELRLDHGAAPSSVDLQALSSLLGETMNEARAVAQGLCPLEPTPEALAPALRRLAKRTQSISGVPCEFLAAGDVRVPDPTSAQHLYRIAQEALSNAVRHARAGRIAVELRGSEHTMTLRVEDNGVGVPESLPSGGMGLRTMAYRAQILEGDFTVEPAAGGGTCVTCRVPRPLTMRDSGGLQATDRGSTR
jgi:signal transduction histidine kinase